VKGKNRGVGAHPMGKAQKLITVKKGGNWGDENPSRGGLPKKRIIITP